MRPIHTALLASALLLTMPFASAHDNATLDTMTSANGGQLRMAGPYHFELLIAPPGKEAKVSPVVVFVTDHAGVKVRTAGAAGTATLLAGGKKTTVALTPDADNRLKGEGVYAASADMKVLVSITMAGAPAESARFTPKMSMAAGEHGKHK